MSQLGFRMGVIHPALVFNSTIHHAAARERKVLGRVQIRQFDLSKGEFGTDQLKGPRPDIDVERAVEESFQVQAARLEDRTLAFQRAVGILLRRAGSHAISLNDASLNHPPFHVAIPCGQPALERGRSLRTFDLVACLADLVVRAGDDEFHPERPCAGGRIDRDFRVL